MKVLVLVLLFVASAFAADTVVGVELGRHRLRAYSVTRLPSNAAPDAVILRGVEISGNKTQQNLDAATFAVQSPDFVGALGNRKGELTCLYSYFSAQGQASTTDPGARDIKASLFQLLVRFWGIIIYKDVDATPGFNVDLSTIGQQVQCPQNPTKDCIAYYYDFTNATWEVFQTGSTQLQYVDPQTNETSPFSVFDVTLQSTDEVFKVNYRFVSRPALIDGKVITPDLAKISVWIKFYNNPKFVTPAAAICGNCKVALSTGTAGRASRADITSKSSGSVTFQNGAIAGTFSWELTANVTREGFDPAIRNVLHTVITDEQITDASLENSGLVGFVILTVWKIATAIWKGFGWSTNLYFFAFDEVTPNEVYWDPEAGADIDYAALGGVAALAPGLIAPFFVSLVAAWFHF